MGLRNITIPERTIVVGDGDITVRGIALGDLMVLVDAYGPQLAIAFQKVQAGGSLSTKDTKLLLASLASEFPDLIAAGIALAADSYDAATVQLVRRLPFQVQIEVVEAIFGLTFTSEAEVKKLLGSLTKMLAEVSGALKTVQLPLPTGIGESAAA